MKRRDWLKQVGVVSTALLGSSAAHSDSAADFKTALHDIVGADEVAIDDRVELHAPEDAANGAVVPVGVVSTLPNTNRIVLLVNNHARAKVAELDTSNRKMVARLSTHLQLQNAAEITALVQSDNRWYRNSAYVNTLGETCEP